MLKSDQAELRKFLEENHCVKVCVPIAVDLSMFGAFSVPSFIDLVLQFLKVLDVVI